VVGKHDVFTVAGARGAVGAYVNPHGFVHQTVTARRARNLSLWPEPPTTKDSWFPGYAWTITNCVRCHQHMGWKFTAAEPGADPGEFWGFVRSRLMEEAEWREMLVRSITDLAGSDEEESDG